MPIVEPQIDLHTDAWVAARRPEDDNFGVTWHLENGADWKTHFKVDVTYTEQDRIERAGNFNRDLCEYICRMTRAILLGEAGTEISGWDLAKRTEQSALGTTGADVDEEYRRIYRETAQKPKTCECEMRLLAQGFPHDANCSKL